MSISLFNSLSDKCKSPINPINEEIKLANNQHIKVIGTVDVKMRTEGNPINTIKFYLLPKTSHPLILGMNYLRSRNITLKFNDYSTSKHYKVKSDKRVRVDPNSKLYFGENFLNICQ